MLHKERERCILVMYKKQVVSNIKLTSNTAIRWSFSTVFLKIVIGNTPILDIKSLDSFLYKMSFYRQEFLNRQW